MASASGTHESQKSGSSGSISSASSSKKKRLEMLLQAFNENDNDDSVFNMLNRWKDLQNHPLVKVRVTPCHVLSELQYE